MPYPRRITPQSVLDKAFELLRRQGLAHLSMRRLADALGVQASSLYRYFPSRESLELAMADKAAEWLETELRTATRDLSPADAFQVAAAAYVAFARNEPALLELLLAPRPTSAGKSLWNFLLKLVGDISGREDDTAGAVALWSFLHGFTLLETSGAFGASGPQGGFETGVAALLRGLGARVPNCHAGI